MNAAEARAMAEAEMATWGLDGWTFDFGRAVARYGSCSGREKRIYLSAALVPRMSVDARQWPTRSPTRSFMKHTRPLCTAYLMGTMGKR